MLFRSKLAKDNPELYKERLVDYYKKQRENSRMNRGFEYDTSNARRQEQARRFSYRIAVNFINNDARRHMQGARFIRNVVSDRKAANLTRRLAVRILNQYAAMAGLSVLAPVIAPYRMMYGLGKGVMNITSDNKGSQWER